MQPPRIAQHESTDAEKVRLFLIRTSEFLIGNRGHGEFCGDLGAVARGILQREKLFGFFKRSRAGKR
jgi:hypothetical protein